MYTSFSINNFFANEDRLLVTTENNSPSTTMKEIASECLHQVNKEPFIRESVITYVEKPINYNSTDSKVNSYVNNSLLNIENIETETPEAELNPNNFSSYEEFEYEFILLAVQLGNLQLEDLDEFWRSNREIVKSALIYDNKNSRSSLQFASQSLQDDREIVLMAIQNTPFALQFASERLQDDKEIVLAAIKDSCYSLQFISERLQDDKEVVLTAMQNSVFALQLASERLRKELEDNREFILSFIKKSSFALQFASPRLRDDKEIVLVAVKKSGWTLQFASKRLQDDEEIVLTAIKKSSSAVEFASKRLQEKFLNHHQVISPSLKRSADALESSPKKKLRSKNCIEKDE